MENITAETNKTEELVNLTAVIKEMRTLISLSQRWLSMREACLYSKMSKNTLMECINENEIKAVKRRGKWIVDRQSIDSYYADDEAEVRVKDLLKGRRL